MADLKSDFGVPDEFLAFLDRGLLTIVSEDLAERTVTFDVPMLQSVDHLKRTTQYSVIWIHPDFNADFCHFYHDTPGDLPNFMVKQETEDVGDELIDLESLDDLLAWLEGLAD